MRNVKSTEAFKAQLAALFDRHGYVRRLNPKRRAKDGPTYKKGDEIRLVARTLDDVVRIARWVRRAGFEPGRPFAKAQQFVLPIYGLEEVARFLKFIGR